jgi:hypothetical protein
VSFGLAVAVGLTPQMLPMIVQANLARSVRQLRARDAAVKRMDAVQNLGSMCVHYSGCADFITMCCSGATQWASCSHCFSLETATQSLRGIFAFWATFFSSRSRLLGAWLCVTIRITQAGFAFGEFLWGRSLSSVHKHEALHAPICPMCQHQCSVLQCKKVTDSGLKIYLT